MGSSNNPRKSLLRLPNLVIQDMEIRTGMEKLVRPLSPQNITFLLLWALPLKSMVKILKQTNKQTNKTKGIPCPTIKIVIDMQGR